MFDVFSQEHNLDTVDDTFLNSCKVQKVLILKALIISWVASFLICHQTKKKHIMNLLFMTVKYDTQKENMWSFWYIKLKNENFVYVTQLFNLYECSYLLVDHKVR